MIVLAFMDSPEPYSAVWAPRAMHVACFLGLDLFARLFCGSWRAPSDRFGFTYTSMSMASSSFMRSDIVLFKASTNASQSFISLTLHSVSSFYRNSEANWAQKLPASRRSLLLPTASSVAVLSYVLAMA